MESEENGMAKKYAKVNMPWPIGEYVEETEKAYIVHHNNGKWGDPRGRVAFLPKSIIEIVETWGEPGAEWAAVLIPAWWLYKNEFDRYGRDIVEAQADCEIIEF